MTSIQERFAIAKAVYCIPPVSFRYRALRASASFLVCCISIVLFAKCLCRWAWSFILSFMLFCAILACGFSRASSTTTCSDSTCEQERVDGHHSNRRACALDASTLKESVCVRAKTYTRTGFCVPRLETASDKIRPDGTMRKPRTLCLDTAENGKPYLMVDVDNVFASPRRPFCALDCFCWCGHCRCR